MNFQRDRFLFNTDSNHVPYIDTYTDDCICDRNERTIQCTGCGFITKGRVARLCKFHQSVIYLLDFTVCPLCDAPAEFIKEYITTRTIDPDPNNNRIFMKRKGKEIHSS